MLLKWRAIHVFMVNYVVRWSWFGRTYVNITEIGRIFKHRSFLVFVIILRYLIWFIKRSSLSRLQWTEINTTGNIYYQKVIEFGSEFHNCEQPPQHLPKLL